VHTLFVREHNRIAEEIGGRIAGGNPVTLSLLADSGLSTGDFIYESARKVVGAELQAITYKEYLPLLLGPGGVGAYSGYDKMVNAGIATEFSTAAFRHGHTLLSSNLYRLDDDGVVIEEIPLRNAFFNPGLLDSGGVDTLLGGLAHQVAQELDHLIVDDVRNFLFGPPGAGGFDLASLNIQRGRDHGLPSLNDIRTQYGLPAYSGYLDLTGGDAELAALFEMAYGTYGIGDVDLWFGGLAEPHVGGGMLGETFGLIVGDQFRRLMDGDRFFYLNDDELVFLTTIFPDIADIRLSDIIRRNTTNKSIQENVFLYTGYVPLPGTLLLLLAGALAGVGTRRGAPEAHRYLGA
jgi:peroxidase